MFTTLMWYLRHILFPFVTYCGVSGTNDVTNVVVMFLSLGARFLSIACFFLELGDLANYWVYLRGGRQEFMS